jgi:hypothetical protein
LLLDRIEDHLIAEGVAGGSTGWAIQKSFLAPGPDKVVAIFETTGEEPGIPKAQGEQAYDKPTFQVRVRGVALGYEEARKKIQECFVALHANEPMATSGEPAFVYLYAIHSGPLPLGLDSNNRPSLTWNFVAMMERQLVP